MDLEIQDNLPDLQRALTNLERKQLPFALALTLTTVAGVAVTQKRKELPRLFNVRSKRVVRGIALQRAEKKDWPFIQAHVGSKDEFMVLQETGGVKRPKKGSKRLAIPTRAVKRTTSGKVRASQKPKAILSKKGSSLAHSSGGNYTIRRKRTKTNRLSIMFFLRPKANIKPKLLLQDTVQQVMRRELAPTFAKSLARALETAKS